jgi:hypothetical protein
MRRLTPRRKEAPENFRLTCLRTLWGRLWVIAPVQGPLAVHAILVREQAVAEPPPRIRFGKAGIRSGRLGGRRARP